jgi:transmembrane sensor
MTSLPSERHYEEAMRWLLRLDDAPADEGLRDRHRSWLADDPLNALAWQQARKGWMIAAKSRPATAAEWPAEVAREPEDRQRRQGKVIAFPARRRRGAIWIAAAAACLALALQTKFTQPFGADYTTSTAEIRQIRLDDGTAVQMAPKSALSADLTVHGRKVSLSTGRAFFDVTRDAARPFVVHAGDVSITVLGTAFDVRVSDETVAVAVRHGQVEVRQARGRVEQRLAPGQQITVDRATGSAVAGQVPELAVGSWADGQLSVVNAPVSDVVSEIRRYHRGWIVIADSRLGSERVTGLYDLRTPDMALKALLGPVGGTIRQVSPFLTILSKSEK